MEMGLISLVGYWVLFGAFFAYVLALGHACRVKHPTKWILVTLFLTIGTCQLISGLQINSLIAGNFFSNVLLGISLFLFPPLVIVNLNFYISNSTVIWRKKIFPALLLFILVSIFLLLFKAYEYRWIMFTGIIHVGIQMIFSFKYTRQEKATNILSQKSFSLYSGIAVLSALAALSGILAYLLDLTLLISLNAALVTVILVLIYSISQRFPNLLLSITKEARKKFPQTHINNLDLKQLDTDLNRVMEDEKPYLDTTLSLKKLAARIQVTPHQLSQYLNEKKGKNFNYFINEYRVSASKKLLLEKTWLTVNAVGEQCGFKSNPVFHSSFKKIVGVSPNQYRTKISEMAHS